MAFELRAGNECMVANDFNIEGRQAFKRGDIVNILEISPDRLQPGNKYLVFSELLSEQVRLPGMALKRVSCPNCNRPLEKTGPCSFSDQCECGWGDVETGHLRRAKKDADAAYEKMERNLLTDEPHIGYDPEVESVFSQRRVDVARNDIEIELMKHAVTLRNEALGLPANDVEDMCAMCGTAATLGKDRCPLCGRNLRGVQFEDGKSVNAGEYFCPKCHAQLLGGALECPACGWQYEQDAEVGTKPRLAYVLRDIVINGVTAFKEGDYVKVEAESPDTARPEYKFVVESAALRQKFRLSDKDIRF